MTWGDDEDGLILEILGEMGWIISGFILVCVILFVFLGMRYGFMDVLGIGIMSGLLIWSAIELFRSVYGFGRFLVGRVKAKYDDWRNRNG